MPVNPSEGIITHQGHISQVSLFRVKNYLSCLSPVLLVTCHACPLSCSSLSWWSTTLTTKGGQATKVKLEVELDDAYPSSRSSSPSSSTPAPSLPGCQAAGDRLRPRGSASRRDKANARAGQHRIFQALPFPDGFSDARSLPDPPPSRRPLQHHASRLLRVDTRS